MGSPTTAVDRLIVGGGLFGCYAAIVLADLGHDVLLVEQAPQLLSRASYVNQARLHTGLHYPRSFLTATEALGHYRDFRDQFPEAIRDFTQIYAVSRHNSKTRGSDFAAFINRLGLATDEIDPDQWFHSGTVSRAFRVEEPTFDADALRARFTREIQHRPKIQVRLNTRVSGGSASRRGVALRFDDGSTASAKDLVLAAYAGTNTLRRLLDLTPLPLTFELAEVVLGSVGAELKDVGFTVMDGPFWSLMPFGHGDLSSLTSVGFTPLHRSSGEPVFTCQAQSADACSPAHLQDCSTCPVRPPSAVTHHVQQMSLFLRQASAFTPRTSLFTVKAVLTSTEVDDARPTLIYKEPERNVTTVFSGKVSTLFDLDKELT